LDTNSELVNAFKTYDDMLERSALQRATSASTEDVHAPAPPVQEGQQQQIQPQQTTTISREGDALAAPYLNERTMVNVDSLPQLILLSVAAYMLTMYYL
jgi:hypothetical protein